MMIPKSFYDAMRPMPVFKPEMREANRQGDKSQTRRVEKEQERLRYTDGVVEYLNRYGSWQEWVPNAKTMGCPYGNVGDYCYMREPLMRHGKFARYKDNNAPVLSLLTGKPLEWRWKKDVLSSIFMPKEAAHYLYRYEKIRLERVQEISRDDAKAEGVSCVWINPPAKAEHYERVLLNPYVANYSVLFDKINAARGYGWDVNPWVWVLEYKRVLVASPGTVGNKLDGLHANVVIFDDFLKGV